MVGKGTVNKRAVYARSLLARLKALSDTKKPIAIREGACLIYTDDLQ